MTEEQVLEAAVAAVKRAKSYVKMLSFRRGCIKIRCGILCRLYSAAIKAGATVNKRTRYGRLYNS